MRKGKERLAWHKYKNIVIGLYERMTVEQMMTVMSALGFHASSVSRCTARDIVHRDADLSAENDSITTSLESGIYGKTGQDPGQWRPGPRLG